MSSYQVGATMNNWVHFPILRVQSQRECHKCRPSLHAKVRKKWEHSQGNAQVIDFTVGIHFFPIAFLTLVYIRLVPIKYTQWSMNLQYHSALKWQSNTNCILFRKLFFWSLDRTFYSNSERSVQFWNIVIILKCFLKVFQMYTLEQL